MDLFSSLEEHTLPISPPLHLPDELDCSWRWDEELGVFFIHIPDGELIYAEDFFTKKISDRSVQYFMENDTLDPKNTHWSEVDGEQLKDIQFKNIAWANESIKLYGKEIPLPRFTAWYGDDGMDYTYSGIKSRPVSWNEGLRYLKECVEQVAQQRFNSVLLNWYRDGQDYLNWHADDEKELGKNPVIASVNFGETRDFVLRRNSNPKQKISVPLKHGSLLIMRGAIQHHWQHSVPKRAKVKKSRFNLTFRNIHLD